MPTDPTHMTILTRQHRALRYQANPSTEAIHAALAALDLEQQRLVLVVPPHGQLEVSIADEACQRVFIFYAGPLGAEPHGADVMAHLTDPHGDPRHTFPLIGDSHGGATSMFDTVGREEAAAVVLAFVQEGRLLEPERWRRH